MLFVRLPTNYHTLSLSGPLMAYCIVSIVRSLMFESKMNKYHSPFPSVVFV